VYNAADNATIVLPLDTAHIGRQVRFDPLPLRIAQPKQIPAHDPILPQENQYRIVTAEKLMSSHPSLRHSGAMRSIELRCAIAHLRISRFPDAQLRI
jgi:hypothetical protein